MTSKKKLIKSTAIVGSGIMTSRVLGFIRDIFIANFFGTKIFAQAFIMAFTVPNVLRQLVAEGAVNTVLVPVLTEYRAKEDKKEFLHFTNVLFNLFLLALFLITIIGIMASPVLVRLIAPGFIMDPYKLTMTIEITRILFPYILLVGLTSYCMGVLNTYKHFAAPAFSSAVFNATLIVGMLLLYRNFEITYLALLVLAGGVVQLLLQAFPMRRRGVVFNLRAGFLHKGAKKVGRLLLPRAVGAGIYQINIVVDRMLASLHLIVGKGAVAALYYGNRLFQLPLALFSIAIATAMLPTMSSLAMEKDTEKLKKTIAFSIKNMLFLSSPAAIGLIVLARPIIKVIFERGEFTPHATDITSTVLAFYALGLVAYGGIRILVTAFYAMQDTVTPVKIAFITLIVNIVLNVILMVPLQAGGLALATSIAGFVNVSFLFIMLKNRIGQFFDRREIIRFLLKIISASFIMGLLAHMLMSSASWDGGIKDAITLVSIILISIAVYLSTSMILKVREIRAVLSWIKRK